MNYERYVEPFGGSGAVLLGKDKPDKFEVINDYNRDLINIFRCIKERPMELIYELGYYPLNARDDFNAMKRFLKKEHFLNFVSEKELELTRKIFPSPSNEELIKIYTTRADNYDIKRAATYLKVLRESYASTGKSYACQPFSIVSIFQLIEAVSKRMENVVVENQDYKVLIPHYDRDNTFFYLDPPYITTEDMYDADFGEKDHLLLRDLLFAIKGYFLLSYNDCEFAREIYKGCNFLGFTRVHSMAQRNKPGARFNELLISNYDLFERERAKPYQLNFFEPYNNLNEQLKERIIYGNSRC